jgi:hypothetical protein
MSFETSPDEDFADRRRAVMGPDKPTKIEVIWCSFRQLMMHTATSACFKPVCRFVMGGLTAFNLPQRFEQIVDIN